MVTRPTTGAGYTWKEIDSTEAKELHADDIIDHLKFGRGKVIEKSGTASNPVIEVIFQTGEKKKIMTNYAKLRKLVKGE